MSTGGVFTIIANDGKADKMIMATDLLRQRIEQVKCARRAAAAKGLPGYEDDTPTLVDVERSHILYVNAHFKPFAAIGYEYQKVNAGQGLLGQQMQYSIPQFGDFFYDMVLNVQMPAVSATALVPSTVLSGSGTGTAGSPPYYANTVAGITRTVTYTQYVDPAGNVIWNPAAAASFNINFAVVPGTTPRADFVHYCEFPGMRLLEQVSFTVNGNPLDQYDYNTYAYYEQFRVRPGKRVGWNRSTGQQVPYEGYGDLQISNTNLVDGGSGAGIVAAAGGDYAQVLYNVVDGAQTPQPVLPAQDWWVKLLFWFNEDVRLSVPSVSIPYGQRFININFANFNNLVFPSGAGLIFQSSITSITYNVPAANNYATSVTVTNSQQPILLGSTIPTPQNIGNPTLYVNNIFVNPEIHDIYIKRIGFNLIRVHRIQRTPLNTNADQVQLTQLKWPIEYFFAGARPAENELGNTGTPSPWVWRNWHRFVKTIPQNLSIPTKVTTTNLPQQAGGVDLTTTSQFNAVTFNGSNNNIVYWQEEETLDTIQISAHQIPIYRTTGVGFYNHHLPFQYGGVNIQTPSDPGAFLINFCLYPGTYQPSGHFNISRAREFYFEYTSSLINSTYVCNLLIDASALNFLLISDGSAVLRYST
jgi:hypothetical protein